MKPKLTNIPTVQNARQNLGNRLESRLMNLFNFLVLIIANNGKKTYMTSLFFLKEYTNIPIISQNINEKINQGFNINPVKKSLKIILILEKKLLSSIKFFPLT